MTTYKQCLERKGVFSSQCRRSVRLKKCPQRRGRISKIVIKTPRKPNSAKRRTAKVILSTRKPIFAKLLGSGGIPHKYAAVLVCGHGYNDTPQVNYRIIRGALECSPLYNRKRRRSIYGVKRRYI